MTQPRDRALNVIPGNIPDLGDMPAGCRFAPRCGCARPECERSMPEMRLAEPGHSVRCFLREKEESVNG